MQEHAPYFILRLLCELQFRIFRNLFVKDLLRCAQVRPTRSTIPLAHLAICQICCAFQHIISTSLRGQRLNSEMVPTERISRSKSGHLRDVTVSESCWPIERVGVIKGCARFLSILDSKIR